MTALDSLRFLAASAVMVTHFHSATASSQIPRATLSGVFDARAAVVLFFVLSGLVLHLNWVGAQPQFASVWRFYLRRWFRIYPLYYVALLISCLVLYVLPVGDCLLLKQWDASAHVIAADHRDGIQWFHHLLLISPGLDPVFLLPPIWTLAEEMKVSLLFPVLSWWVARSPRIACLMAIGALFAAAPWLSQHVAFCIGLLPLFALGAWVAQHHRQIAPQSELGLWGVALLGLLLYSTASGMHWRLHQPMMGVGSAMIMLAVLNESYLRQLLSYPLLTTAGRCSYGIYVLHFPVLLAVVTWAGNHGWSDLLIYGVGLTLSLLLALALHATVEIPMMQFCKRLVLSMRK